MLHWSIEIIHLNLKYTWKIARNATDFKKNIIVTVSDGNISGKGEGAPNVRYNESAEACVDEFNRFVKILGPDSDALTSIHNAIKDSSASHALAFAIESAWFHYRSKSEKKSVPELLNITSPGPIPTSYTIPIMETGLLKKFFIENNLKRFPYIKLKVNADDAYDSLTELISFCNQPIMVDANEAFKDVEQCILWIEKIKKIPLVFVEQPLPSTMKAESEYLKKHSPFIMMADEVITDTADFSELKKSFDGINMKLMKAGGYMNGLRLLKEARQHNMKTMIGCMVETSLGISSAMNLCAMTDYADLDSFILLKEEPFGMIDEKNGVLSFRNSMAD